MMLTSNHHHHPPHHATLLTNGVEIANTASADIVPAASTIPSVASCANYPHSLLSASPSSSTNNNNNNNYHQNKMSHVPSSTFSLNDIIPNDDHDEQHSSNHSEPTNTTINYSNMFNDSSAFGDVLSNHSRSPSPLDTIKDSTGHHQHQQQSNGTSSSSSSPIGGGHHRNKRKNFKPRCISDETPQPSTTTNTDENINDNAGTENILMKQRPPTTSSFMEQFITNSSLTSTTANNIISQLINDHLNNSQSTQQQPKVPTSAPGITANNRKHLNESPLDLSNLQEENDDNNEDKEQELQRQQQQILQQMFLMQKNPQNTVAQLNPQLNQQHLLELFLWKNIRQSPETLPQISSSIINKNETSTSSMATSSSSANDVFDDNRHSNHKTKESPFSNNNLDQQKQRKKISSNLHLNDPIIQNDPKQTSTNQPSMAGNLVEFLQFYNQCFNNNNNRGDQLSMMKQLFQNQSTPSPTKNKECQQQNNVNNNNNSSVTSGDENSSIDENQDDQDDGNQSLSDLDESSSTSSNRLAMLASVRQQQSEHLFDPKSKRKDQAETIGETTTEQMLSKSLDFEKLKQLQQLYKLNLMQHLDGSMTTGPFAKNFPFESMFMMHQQQQLESIKSSNNKPQTSLDHLSHNHSTNNQQANDSGTNNSDSNKVDNITYVKDLFRNKVINAKSSSRRPLSSWKQSINACGPGPAPWIEKSTLHSLGIQGELIHKSMPIDYTHYVKRYANSSECGSSLCRELSYREHFHCNARSCNSRVFMKKEEMIRHFKWHKKRDESLTHGFLRCSPGDNCIERFKNCPHNRKQTHYHCLKRGCDKVYISTSDVQMHANYHRKDTAIIQEGFQRFRATENCLLETCAFYGQKTTHFHCRRDNCNHTFKNKADMEKHKSYHVRDEQLARDGFRKFQKHETCTASDECRSSRVCNHYHCLRSGCTHVLHSTAQLYPHKRKHERTEKELAYRKYRLAQTIYQQTPNNAIGKIQMQNRLAAFGINLDIDLNQNEDFEAMVFNSDDDSAIDNLTEQLPVQQIIAIPIEEMIADNLPETRCLKYIQRHSQTSSECNFDDIDDAGQRPKSSIGEHFNCIDCNICFNDHSSTIIHTRRHAIQEEIIPLMFNETNDQNICTSECLLNSTTVRHYHCRMYGCIFISPLQDNTLKKLEHYRYHEEQQHLFNLYLEDLPPPMPPPPPTINHNHNNSNSSNKSSTSQLLLTPEHQQQKTPPPSEPTPPPPPIPSSNSISNQQKPSKSKPLQNENNHNNHKGHDDVLGPIGPILQVFPTGTTLASIDGMPILKRKRGRPPKNRTEVLNKNTSDTHSQSTATISSHSSTSPTTTATSTIPSVPFDLAQAFSLRAANLLKSSSTSASNIPLNLNLNVHPQSTTANIGGDLSKTIPIPLIMPYIKSSIHIGFYVFDEETLCPDVTCAYLGQKHFHCSKPRCYYSTNRDDNTLLEHSKDFHDNIDILEGFVYFNDNVDCKSNQTPSGIGGCPYNRKQKHFHCTRNGCNFTFSRYSMMQAHEQKHYKMEKLNHKLDDDDDNDILDDNHGNQDNNRSDDEDPSDDLKIVTFEDEDEEEEENLDNSKNPSTKSSEQLPTTTDPNEQFMKLMQNRMETLGGLTSSSTITSQPMMNLDDIVKQHPAFDENNPCPNNGCKLKRKYHFHCRICNQVFNNYERLVPHCLKHSQGQALTSNNNENSIPEDPYHQNMTMQANIHHQQPAQSNPMAAAANLTNEFFQMFLNNLMMNTAAAGGNPMTAMNPLLQSFGIPSTTGMVDPLMKQFETNNATSSIQTSTKRRGSFSSDSSNNNSDFGLKKHKSSSSSDQETEGASGKLKTSECNQSDQQQSSPSPNGSYLRFRFNEDCGFQTCVYREHQTHFHCMRKDCGYSFCDKTRFVQHTARHDRLDSLMGGDFQQYRCSVSCGQADCPYGNPIASSPTSGNSGQQSKTSHFHCLKCDYVCADTNKVVAHRRQHAKMDNISAAGFEKYAPNQDCQVDICNYKLKQTHYHCSTCNYSVLGLSQMTSHKQKHQQQPNQQTQIVEQQQP